MRIIMNTLTYIGLICFNMSILITAYVGQKVVFTKIVDMLPNILYPQIIDYVLWCGFIFVVIICQNISYPLYKKYVHIKKIRI